MTWTCPKCDNVNPTSECKCLRDGCDGAPWKEAGLSEEERAAWEAYRGSHLNVLDNGVNAYPTQTQCSEGVRFAVNVYRAARAPLEAEVTKLRSAIKDMERQRDNANQATAASAERAERLREAYAREQHGMIERGKQIAARETRIHELKARVSELEAQLAQAQKPAAPAGLPEVNAPVEVVHGGEWIPGYVADHGDEPETFWVQPVCRGKQLSSVLRRMSEKDRLWRLPPAQTSREPTAVKNEIPGIVTLPKEEWDDLQEMIANPPEPPQALIDLMKMAEPAASPPGEVSTEHLDKEYERAVGPQLVGWMKKGPMHVAVIADIRANVECETKELRHDLDYHMHMAKRDKSRIADLVAEVERLKGELAKEKVTNAEVFERVRRVAAREALIEVSNRSVRSCGKMMTEREMEEIEAAVFSGWETAKANGGKAKP